MPAGGISGIGLVTEVDGFTQGCANWLSGRSIHGPADGSDVNPSNTRPCEAAAGSSGAGARAGLANEVDPSSHGSSNEGDLASPDPNAGLLRLRAKTGPTATSAEAARIVANADAHRNKRCRRPSSFRTVVFMFPFTPSIPNS